MDITPAGLIWTEAEIVEVTRDRVSVVYRGVRTPLNRDKLAGVFGANCQRAFA